MVAFADELEMRLDSSTVGTLLGLASNSMLTRVQGRVVLATSRVNLPAERAISLHAEFAAAHRPETCRVCLSRITTCQHSAYGKFADDANSGGLGWVGFAASP